PTADQVVIGHRGINEKFSTGLLGSTAESVTRKCPKPVFVATLEFRPVARPLLGYDGSQRAAAAMHAAAEFCVSLSLPLTVVTVSKDSEAGERIISDARKYLASYNLPSTCEVVNGHAPEQIVSCLTER